MSVVPIKRKKGTVYRAQARVMRDGKTVLSESKTFDKRTQANAWRAMRQAELEKLADGEVAASAGSVGKVIQRYIEEFCGNAGKTKVGQLKHLLTYPFATLQAEQLTSGVLVDHVRARRLKVGPATAMTDMIWMRTVYRTARLVWRFNVPLEEVESALYTCKQFNLVAVSTERDRRPTSDELARLSDYFLQRAQKDKRVDIPMHDIMWFAVHSTRREAEITRLLRSDNDERDKSGMVRDLKHPRRKKGNNKRFKYTDEAWKIMKRQPETGDIIFPYNPRSVSKAFTNACDKLGIEDLHFHDLRHEATSRLFEAGYSIPEVQLFSLHEDWNNLRRYTQLRIGDLKVKKSRKPKTSS